MSQPEMLPDYVARNRVYWDEVNAPRFAEAGARDWQREVISWGTFGVPADELHALPRDVSGNVVELRLWDRLLRRLAGAPRGADSAAYRRRLTVRKRRCHA
jgi:hypothetical protein